MLLRVGVAAALVSCVLVYALVFNNALLDRAASVSWALVGVGATTTSPANGLACSLPDGWSNGTVGQARSWGASFSVPRTCAPAAGAAQAPRNALVVSLPPVPMAHDMVNLRRFCEVAGLVYDAREWKLRVYLATALTDAQRALMAVRCRMCVEEVVVTPQPDAPLWWAKYHAVSDTQSAHKLRVGLFRSLHSRPTPREAQCVAAWLASPRPALYHTIRDHPTLHRLPIVPHLWGFNAGDNTAFVAAWNAVSPAFGEEAFLAAVSPAVLPSMMAHDSFHADVFARSTAFPPAAVRRGLDYAGRLADHRERDIHGGWRAMLALRRAARPVTTQLPPCLAVWNATSWKYTLPGIVPLVDGERRYLSYCLYGRREVDKVEMLKTLELLKRKDFYWGWSVLMFVSGDVNDVWIRELVNVGVPIEIYVVQTWNTCSFWARDPMLWRGAFAMALSHVDRFVSRDADSVSLPREWHAVQEWIASGLNFHLMRDHDNGHGNAVMGGMWGAVGGAFDIAAIVQNNPRFGHDDQTLYSRDLFPPNVALQLGHDSQSCVQFAALPFSDPKWIHYVGQTPRYRLPIPNDNPSCEALRYNEFLS